jgi:pimeloyl-ACP methyl ester carboxylesterase
MTLSMQRGTQTLQAGLIGLACLSLSACQSLAPAKPEAAARQLDRSLEVLTSADVGVRARQAAQADYRRAVNRLLPAVLREESAPAISLAPADPPRWPGADDVTEITPVHRRRETTPALHRDGLGSPAIGVVVPSSPNSPRRGYRVPLTVLALPAADAAFQVRLADPTRVDSVRVDQRSLPVAMDLDAPLDATRALGPDVFAGFRYLLRANRFGGRSRVTFLQPFDANKRPLVLIHGLMTTPRMWDRLGRELLADPLVRENYQIWFFFYPTAQPVPLSALQLREALDDASRRHALSKPMVLVGYSMGGVLASAQVSGLTIDDAERILPGVSMLPEASPVRQALTFEPRQDVSRAVFMFTPHRGSRLASLSLTAWATRLIQLPEWVRSELTAVADTVVGLSYGTLPTSIHGLSPDSQFLQSLAQVEPRVPTHSIIGDRGRRGDLLASSDGVVPYSSAHRPEAVSERVVPTGHGGFDHPQSVAELIRILHLELETNDASSQAPSLGASPPAR